MADYKELLTDSIEVITEKAKEFAETTGIREVYESGLSRTKNYARIAGITALKKRDSDELRRVYIEIGRLYYEQNHTDSEGIFASLFSQVDELTEKIKDSDKKIEAVRAAIAGYGSEVE